MKKELLPLLVGGALLGTAGPALGIAVTDLSFTYFNGTTIVTEYADQVLGPNYNENTPNESIAVFGDTFKFIAKDENSTNPSAVSTGTADGVAFTFNAVNFVKTGGEWALSWTGSIPVYFDFVVATKAGNDFAYYFFDNIYLADVPNNSGSGTYLIGYHQSPTSDNTSSLSHLSLYGVSDSIPVPEPATMLLFGTGLAGLAGIARRKK